MAQCSASCTCAHHPAHCRPGAAGPVHQNPIEEAAPTGFWWTGPAAPGRQWAGWWAQVQDAEHWAIRSWLLVTGLVLCLIGTAAALVTWVSQHPGAVLLLAVLCGLWWGALAADMEAAKTVGEGTR